MPTKTANPSVEVCLTDALAHIRMARQCIGAAQRELPGQSNDELQQRITSLWGEAYELQQRISVFKRDARERMASSGK